MGQLLVRRLSEDARTALRRRAESASTSVEAEAREVLEAVAAASVEQKRATVQRNWQLSNAAKVPDVAQTPGWQLIREDRDAG